MPSNIRPKDFPAPAKINRFLHITGRRADGYHELETLYHFLELGDSLHFEPSAQPHIRRIDRHDYPLPEEDMCVRAARLLQTTVPRAAGRGVTITLFKRIPPGSGLGGGSSDAATTLLVLNHLWRLELTRSTLADLGRQLGADVPVFIRGRAARAAGIGDILTPVAAADQWICLCIPPVAVSSARVYAHPQLRRQLAGADGGIRDKIGNDLEPITALLHPQVAETLAVLRRHGDAQMSGSGSAVYAGFKYFSHAMRAMKAMEAEQLPGVKIYVTLAIGRHRLLNFPGK